MEEVETCFTQRLRHPWETYKGSPLARLFSDVVVKKPSTNPLDSSPEDAPRKTQSSPAKPLPRPQSRSFFRRVAISMLFPIWLISWPVRKLWEWLQKR